MFCKKCGETLPDGAVFCGNCGNRIEQNGFSGQTPVVNNGGYSSGNQVQNNPFNSGSGMPTGNGFNYNGNTGNTNNVSSGSPFQSAAGQDSSKKTVLIIVPIALVVIIGVIFAVLYFTGVIGNKSDPGKTVVETTLEYTEETTAPSDDESTAQSISVDFKKYNDSIYISSDKAQLAVTIKIEGGKILRYGFELYNEEKSFLTHAEEKYSQTSDNDSFLAIFDTDNDMDYSLKSSTTYRYRFYVVTKEEKIYSEYQAFTTSNDPSDIPEELREYADGLVETNDWYVVKLNNKNSYVNLRSEPFFKKGLDLDKDDTIVGKIKCGTEIYVEYIYDGMWAVTYRNNGYVFVCMFDGANKNNKQMLVRADD